MAIAYSRNDRRIAVALFLAALGVLVAPLRFGLPSWLPLIGGLRILDGEVPYRDFWTIYAPGSYYVSAALFALFGRHAYWQSLLTAILGAGAASAFFLLLRRAGAGRAFSLAGGLFWTATQPRP